MTDHTKEMQKHIRTQKLRKARRKSGRKKKSRQPRQKNWIPDSWDDLDDLELEFKTRENIYPRGERERRREIENAALGKSPVKVDERTMTPEDAASTPDDSLPTGLVTEVSSGMCRVELASEIILCTLRGSLKHSSGKYTNLVAVGDQVRVHRSGSERGVVEAVLPRRSVLARPYMPDQGKVIADLEQIVVANVDRLLAVASWREPYIWPALIDRYLIAAQRNNIEAVICINKTDLVEDQTEFDATVQPYQTLGYRLVLTSTVTDEGIDELNGLLTSGVTVLAGLSGVGKSSLLVAVQPDLDLKVGQVSEHGLFTGQGRHTTTQSSLWKLENGGIVIDTPGVRTFGVAGIPPTELANWYPELIAFADQCRYRNCTHINEPDCAIQAAVEEGSISQLRYKNYIQIFKELAG